MAADTVTSTTSVIVSCVGLALGSSVGLVDGDRLGPELGVVVGKRVVGDAVGFEVVGPDDGDVLGISVVGLPEGDVLGCFVGLELGAAVIGLADGGVVCPLRVGDWVGCVLHDVSTTMQRKDQKPYLNEQHLLSALAIRSGFAMVTLRAP